MKILVVEDDLLVADALKTMLSQRNYAVEVVNDGRSGLDFIEAFDYDLLLLDAILPKLDGVSLCRYVRSRGYMMPILLLTSQDGTHDRAIGLDAGADDYIVKPFEPEELSARIRALLRRGKERAQPLLTWEDLTLDPRTYEVTYQQQLLNLTPKEYALLELFLRHNRRLFSCGSILEHLWTYEDAPSEEAVRTHIKGLRHKLKAAGAPANLVETVYGIGYRLKGEPLPEGIVVERHEPDIDNELVGAALVPIAPKEAEPEQIPTHRHPDKSDKTEELPQFLLEIWNRHYPQMLDRLASIDRVIAAYHDGSLDAEIRQQAWHSAHTLAGAIGTFGLAVGSQLAKQIELLLDANTDLNADRLAQLHDNLERLRQEIASKVPAAEAPTDLPSSPEIGTSPSSQSWLLTISNATDLVRALRDAATARYEIVAATELLPSQLDRSPNAILLDLDCFPQIEDGLAALSALNRDYPHLPVVVLNPPQLTGDLNAPDRGTEWLSQRIEIANRGARLCVSKLMPPRQILLAVDRLLERVRASQPRVTIVDDDLALLEGVSALLSMRGMTVTTLSEPSLFWETLETSQPDLLILDLDMPMHDGIELCRAVRTDPKWSNLPVLFLTAHSAAIASDRVFAAGADDFVTKPVVGSTLVTRIVNRLDRIGNQRMSQVLPTGNRSIQAISAPAPTLTKD